MTILHPTSMLLGDEGCARGTWGLVEMIGILDTFVSSCAQAPGNFLPWRSLEGARGSRRCYPIALRSRAGHVSGPEIQIACVLCVDRLGR